MTAGGKNMKTCYKTVLVLGICLSFILVFGAMTSWAQGVGYLLIPGVKGDVKDAQHRNWIEVIACGWGTVPGSNSVKSGGKDKTVGKICFSDFSITKPVDSSSELLKKFCNKGNTISEVTVAINGEDDCVSYLVLKGVIVRSVRPGVKTAQNQETEIVTLKFRQVVHRE